MKKGIIYGMTNLINGKIYVGQTVKGLKHRWRQHCWNAKNSPESQPITKAINRYGEENFVVYTLEENIPEINLDLREGIWIFRLRSANKESGYNIFIAGRMNAGSRPMTI